MSEFNVYTPENAPAGSQASLAQLRETFGFLPNMYAVMAESPAVLEAANGMREAYRRSSLSRAEQEIVLLAVSVENRCEFCAAAHSFMARHVIKLPDAEVDALRQGRGLADARSDAIARFTRLVVRRRGRLEDSEVDAFLAAGFSRAQLIEVILGVAMKTLHNYIDHVAHAPLNPQFESERWSPKQAAA